jgi:hypothetical protein
MNPRKLMLMLGLAIGLAATVQAAAPDDPAAWSVYITNDNCPDYTWGLTEAGGVEVPIRPHGFAAVRLIP